MADTKVTTTNPKRKSTGRQQGQRALHGLRMDSGLTTEQEAYCRARAMGMSVDEALLTAGNPVSHLTARKWEKAALVRDRIAALTHMATDMAIQNTGLNREWVISRLMSVAERCMQSEPVLDKDGAPTGEYQFNSTGATQALKLLGDTMGLFKPAEKKPEDEYANLSDEDLKRIATELAAQTGLIELSPSDVIDVTPKT